MKGKTKEQLPNESAEMRQRIAELEASEIQRKRAEEALQWSRIWLLTASMFVLLCILVWLNEILDLPHLLLGAPHTPINWQEAITETVMIAGIGLFAVSRLIHDITERKRAERALRESEEKFRALFDSMTEGFGLHEIILDAGGRPCDFRFLELNAAWERLTGIPRATVVGKTMRQVWPDLDAYWLETYGKVALTGEAVHYENFNTPLQCWYETFAYSTKPNHFALLFVDITERKRAEEALRRSEMLLSEMSRMSKIGAWELDVATMKQEWTDETFAIHDRERGIYDPDSTEELSKFEPGSKELIGKAFEEAIGQGKPYDLEVEMTTVKGNSKWVRAVCIPLLKDGKVTKLRGTVQDITERKQAEQRLAQYAQELERSNRELEQFAYVASHDLQEPLRMVSSFTQLLARRYRGKLDADADEFIAFAVDGANRMQRLINDLLLYSRVGTRGKPFEPTDCHAVLGQVRANLSAAIAESGALVTNDELPTVVADESQLVQLLQNLIGNAIKFRKPDEPPRVHVSATLTSSPSPPMAGGGEGGRGVGSQGHFWLFSVRDNGIGIDSKYYERIFVIFQQLHGKEKYPGTGIGLSICKRIVERHGGRIWVESALGEGSTFYFTLPVKGGNPDE
jgi:PAS domain S-box-containing protein